MTRDAVQEWRTADFDFLPLFSRAQVSLWNAMQASFGENIEWQNCVADGLAEFFEVPGGFLIGVRQTNTVEAQRNESVFSFDASEITLGRDTTCDIHLTPRSIAGRHARIFNRSGKCYLEDLGSGLGTYLNDEKLEANRPALLKSGDRFAIFPFSFALELEQKWVPARNLEIRAGPVTPVRPNRSHSLARIAIGIRLHPIGAALYLETSRIFLEKLTEHLLAPLCPEMKSRLGLAGFDMGLLELLTAAVLARINSELQFPLQAETREALLPSSSGLEVPFVLRAGELEGPFRLIVGNEAMEALSRCGMARARAGIPKISWRFPFSVGYADLTAEEVCSIESGDVVLLIRQAALLFPNTPRCGWSLAEVTSNCSQARLDNYFERAVLNERENEGRPGDAPELNSLPVCLHAIAGEKEMTLAEVSGLVTGSIVELDQSRSEPVRISLNGKIAGTGELVEIDGRLGVRILSWRTQ